jgi:hypothetical protein
MPRPLAEVERARHLFAAGHLRLFIEAVIAGSFRATFWADDPADPGTALAWDGGHDIYLVGAVDRPDEWRELLASEVLSAGHGGFGAVIPDAVVGTVLPGHRLERRERVFYRGAAAGGRPDRLGGPNAVAGLRISEINECFDDLVGLANAAGVVAEIESMWPSLDAFRRHGFGFVAHDDTTIAGWCTAEYVSPGRCGIGIETYAAFRRRGIATATASAFLARCAAAGLTPHWDAWASNQPSIAVAERIGLGLVETYAVQVGAFADGGTR